VYLTLSSQNFSEWSLLRGVGVAGRGVKREQEGGWRYFGPLFAAFIFKVHKVLFAAVPLISPQRRRHSKSRPTPFFKLKLPDCVLIFQSLLFTSVSLKFSS